MGPGRLQDIQLIAQAATLASGRAKTGTQAGLGAGRALGWWDKLGAEALSRAASLCRDVQMAARLLGDDALDADQLGSGARAFVLRETGCADIAELVEALDTRTRAAAEVIDAALRRAGQPANIGQGIEG